jgi:hypothetical protein
MVLFGQIISTILSIPGLRPTHLHIKLVAGFITGSVGEDVSSGQGVILTTHLRLASRFIMSGAIPLVPLYTFMACTGITLRLNSVR